MAREFARIYKAKDENTPDENELNRQLAKCKKMRQKYIDMYADDLISREELHKKAGEIKAELERLENEQRMARYGLEKGGQLEEVVGRTFRRIEDIVSVREMTNAQLKQVIQKIEVDKDGNVDISLHLFGGLGPDRTFPVHHNGT